MDKLQLVTEIGKSPRERQILLNVSEVFSIWDILVMKFDIMETVQIFEKSIEDYDLKIIKDQVASVLQKGIEDMEELMNLYGLPFPIRPPVGSNSTLILEYVTDREIYQSFFEGLQAFFPLLAAGFMNSTSPRIRKAFKVHLISTIETHEILVEYGKLKGYLNEPPVYRV
jgi:hypothetical protein